MAGSIGRPRRSRTRHAWVVVLAITVLIGLPVAAVAKAPDRGTDRFVEMYCDLLTNASGTVEFSASASEVNGVDAYTAYWADPAEPYVDAPTLQRDWSDAVSATTSGSTISGTIPLVDGSFEPADPATFSMTYTIAGDPQSIDEDYRDGNRRYRSTGSYTPLTFTGTLTIPGADDFDLSSCLGNLVDVTFFGTNPNAFVNRNASRSVGCEIELPDGDFVFVYIDLNVEEEVYIDVSRYGPTGGGVGMFGVTSTAGGVISTPLDAYDLETGDPSGTGAIEATIASTGEPFQYTVQRRAATLRVRGTALDVQGNVTFPDDSVVSIDSCVATDLAAKEMVKNPQGPKPGGKVPRNDKPSGAITLAAGARLMVSTKGADPVQEAAFDCLSFTDPDTDEVIETPVGHTVWYKVTGTGADLTIDPAGSNFDTVVATYTQAVSGAFVPVPDGCVDDAALEPIGLTLQGPVTIPTTAGTTYWIQIGGYPDGFPYGNLRVAIR